jgi:hypothetical protein
MSTLYTLKDLLILFSRPTSASKMSNNAIRKRRQSKYLRTPSNMRPASTPTAQPPVTTAVDASDPKANKSRSFSNLEDEVLTSASIETAKVALLKDFVKHTKELVGSIKVANRIEILKNEYMILKDMNDIKGAKGILQELRALKDPPVQTLSTTPTPTTSVEGYEAPEDEEGTSSGPL